MSSEKLSSGPEPVDGGAAPIPRRWTFYTTRLAIVAFLVALTLAAANAVLGAKLPFHLIMAVMLIAFALLKLSVGSDALLRLRGAAGVDPAEVHGGRGMAMSWVAYKYLAALVALGAAVYVLTVGAGRVDAIFGQ